MDREDRNLEHDDILVRRLLAADLNAVIRLDAKITGRQRTEYFKLKLKENLAETGIKISLAAELDGGLVGYLLARVYYGEFGMMEPAAVLDTIGVHPDFQHRGVGVALMRQICTDLAGLGGRSAADRGELGGLEGPGFLPARGLPPGAAPLP